MAAGMEAATGLAGSPSSVMATGVLLVAAVFCLLLLLAQPLRRRVPKGLKPPPGPRGLPVVGNVLELRKDPHLALTRLSQKYGDVMEVAIGSQPVLVLSGLDTLRQALVRQGEDFMGRPDLPSFRLIADGQSLGFSPEVGEVWKARRKLAQNALKTFSIAASPTSSSSCLLEEHISKEAAYLVTKFLQVMEEEQSFDPCRYLVVSVANVICAMCFGKRYDHNDQELLSLVNDSEKFGEVTAAGNPSDFIPLLRYLPSRSMDLFKDYNQRFVRFLQAIVKEHYETYDKANILEFRNGSVLVHGEVLFQGIAPSSSHLIRTLLTEASRAGDAFSWRLEPRSVRSGGFSLENLDPEKLSISLTALQLGQDGAEPLVSEVIRALSALYPVRNFTIGHLRPLGGDLEVTGDLYLDTALHADIAAVLQALRVLASSSVDLSSLSVQGARLSLQVYPISFLVTNRRFSERLLDPLAEEHRGLARDLGEAVARALQGHRSFLQAAIRGFLPGSLLCHGDVLFQPPAPTSLEVLEALALAVGPDEALAGSAFHVDPYSIAVGEDTLEPPPAPGFPESVVAIMVVCILVIVTVPIILLVVLRTKRGSWSDVAVLWDRRDPEVGTQTLEMENQGFWVASEQDMEEASACWQTDSAS
uniref:Cytochrome P450 1A n=1 Tax=Cairina moschata TaxID=8855 RepID=A0A8C3CHC1_CAIMO